MIVKTAMNSSNTIDTDSLVRLSVLALSTVSRWIFVSSLWGCYWRWVYLYTRYYLFYIFYFPRRQSWWRHSQSVTSQSFAVSFREGRTFLDTAGIICEFCYETDENCWNGYLPFHEVVHVHSFDSTRRSYWRWVYLYTQYLIERTLFYIGNVN